MYLAHYSFFCQAAYMSTRLCHHSEKGYHLYTCCLVLSQSLVCPISHVQFLCFALLSYFKFQSLIILGTHSYRQIHLWVQSLTVAFSLQCLPMDSVFVQLKSHCLLLKAWSLAVDLFQFLMVHHAWWWKMINQTLSKLVKYGCILMVAYPLLINYGTGTKKVVYTSWFHLWKPAIP